MQPDEFIATLEFEAWLKRSVIDFEGSLARENPSRIPDNVGGDGVIPAEFISRAVRNHHSGLYRITSGIRSPGLTIIGDLHLENFSIPFPLFFDGCRFIGDLHIWGMKAATISLDRSQIEGGIDIRGTELDGNLLMRDGIVVLGPVIARDMKISGSAEFERASFLYNGIADNVFAVAAQGGAFSFSRSLCRGFYWRDFPVKPSARVTLRDVYTTSFVHDLDENPPLRSWPDPGKLILDGFRYDRIEQCDYRRAIDWLQLQPNFTASSYTNLANAFSNVNLNNESEHILAEFKHEEIRQTHNKLKRYILQLVYWVVGYGLRPQRALFFLACLFLLHVGSVWYWQKANEMHPAVNDMLLEPCFYGPSPDCTKNINSWIKVKYASGETRYIPHDYPELHPIQYSLEAFLPFFDLRQRQYWEPASAAANVALSSMAALGIFLGGLFVGAISGLLAPRAQK